MNQRAWEDAVWAAALVAADPVGLGGVVVRARAGPVRDRWRSVLTSRVGPGVPRVRVPLHVSEDRLLGGLDLAATLHARRVVTEPGLLPRANGGFIVLPMAERLSPTTVAVLAGAIDRGAVHLEREGMQGVYPARFGVIAYDEGEDEERVHPSLRDRLALHVDLDGIALADASGGAELVEPAPGVPSITEVEIAPATVESLCASALVLGIASLRPAILAVRVARASAALAGRSVVGPTDAERAARLVLGPRATRYPQPPDPEEPSSAEPEENTPDPERSMPDSGPLADVILAAARSAMPAGALDRLAHDVRLGGARRTEGVSGARGASVRRGRPVGVWLRAGGRVNVIETLRAAAPWQRLRRGSDRAGHPRIEVRKSDFRFTRYEQRTETTSIFVVDASGSAAFQRLAEAKGAVERLLADAYVRRDQVALIAFRGTSAELLVPPTRSLVRARRCLAGLPGGGTTPIAAGLQASLALAEETQRRGRLAVVVVMTDGRANVGRDGQVSRSAAADDALTAARALRERRLPVLFVDTAPRPRPVAAELAKAMGAEYLALPYTDAAGISGRVQALSRGEGR